jgi:hypothetical protein
LESEVDAYEVDQRERRKKRDVLEVEEADERRGPAAIEQQVVEGHDPGGGVCAVQRSWRNHGPLLARIIREVPLGCHSEV